MKLKVKELKPKLIKLVPRQNSKMVNYPPTKMNWMPKYSRESVAYKFLNREFRNKRHSTKKPDEKFDNPKFRGIGSRGKQMNHKENLSRADGYNPLRKEKVVQDINLDEVAIQEQMQLNFKGTELKGKRITDKSEAIACINQYGGKRKFNRGGQGGGIRSGLYSGGLMMRAYEKAQIKKPNKDFIDEDEDEFSNLQELIQSEQTDSDIKTSNSGL